MQEQSDTVLETHTLQTALDLFNAGQQQEARDVIVQLQAANPDDFMLNHFAGIIHFHLKEFRSAVPYLTKSIESQPQNMDAYFYKSLALYMLIPGSLKNTAIARDFMLEMLARFPAIKDDMGRYDSICRALAVCCSNGGPKAEAARLWAEIAERSGRAEDYFSSSEAHADIAQVAEAEIALKKAIALEPERFSTPRNLEALEFMKSKDSAPKAKSKSFKWGKYPEDPTIKGDLRATFMEYLAGDLKDAEKFIHKGTRFFTIGACYSRDIARHLTKQGYDAYLMPLSDNINSTSSNLYFFDWLADDLTYQPFIDSVVEQLPDGVSREFLLQKLLAADVFIYTLGTAGNFFDREDNRPILLRPGEFYGRAAAQKFQFRTTTVDENVQNLTKILTFIRRLKPTIKIVLTIAPNPMAMTFESQSAVAADCLSKSTLRVTADQMVNHSGLSDVYYFPAFEVFRWLGSHLDEAVYGTDDGLSVHVADAKVEMVTSCFLEVFSGQA